MRALFFLLALVASESLAQGQNDVSRGNILKRPEYQTYATISLFVDGTLGSDSNPCTASGASACRTLAGALSKLPRFIRHNVTITVAAGTYAESLNITNGLYINNAVTVAIVGALDSFTPATGTNSGTTSAATAASSSGPPSITDSTQTWTVNNLKGRFVSFTSGSLSGSVFPITSNTATTLSMAGTASAGVGAAYSIVTPSVIFAQPASGTISNLDARGTLSFNSIDITSGVGIGTGVFFNNGGTISVNRCRFLSNGNGTAFSAAGSMTLFNSVFQNDGSGAGFISTAGGRPPAPTLTLTNTYFRATTGIALNILSNSMLNSAQFPTGNTLEVTTGTGLVNRSGTQATSGNGFYVTCTTAGSGIGAAFGTNIPLVATNSYGPGGSFTWRDTGQIVGCGSGVLVYGSYSLNVSSMNFSSVTNAIVVARGGYVVISGTPTFTTVTNELSLDGTTYTYAFLNGLSPQVISNSYSSVISK